MELTLPKPDDFHLHLRDGDILETVLPYTIKRFRRALVMPNLKPPITSIDEAAAYREKILAALPDRAAFTPLMTLYLTSKTTQAQIRTAADSGFIVAAKLYPAGATTNSDSGIQRIKDLYPIFETMQDSGLVLAVHGEVPNGSVDVFEREAKFIDWYLQPLCEQFPSLKIILEHVTTRVGVQFVEQAREGIAATVTPHHLLMNRNALFDGGIRPHHFCLPVLKHERDREALIRAATSGNPRFFLGTDSAPHTREHKESACGCAGIFNAHAALEIYASIFHEVNALDRLAGFASRFGARFYGLPENAETITLHYSPWRCPERYEGRDTIIVPLQAGQQINWSLK